MFVLTLGSDVFVLSLKSVIVWEKTIYSLILFIILKIVNWPIKGVTGTRGGLPNGPYWVQNHRLLIPPPVLVTHWDGDGSDSSSASCHRHHSYVPPSQGLTEPSIRYDTSGRPSSVSFKVLELIVDLTVVGFANILSAQLLWFSKLWGNMSRSTGTCSIKTENLVELAQRSKN